MKTMKKLASLTLALLLTIALAAPAMAATVTINPPAEGIDETYTAYKIFDAVVDENGNQTVTDPTGTASTFTSVLYTIENTSPFFDTVNGFEGITLAPVAEGSTTYAVQNIASAEDESEFTFNFDAAKLADALMAVVNAEGFTGASVPSNGNKLTLADGYFLIVGSLGSKAILDTFGKENATIQTKNTLSSLTLKVKNTSDADYSQATTAAYGEQVNFQVEITPAASASGKMIVTINKNENLTYDDSTEGDYILNITAEEVKAAVEAGTTITKTFTAQLNGDVDTATGYDTTATLTFGTDNYTTLVSDATTATVTTYEIDIFKYRNAVAANEETEGDKIALPGAGFVLMNYGGQYYQLSDNNTVSWVADENTATEFESTALAEGATTNVRFPGLAAGEYTIHEKTVPTGYNRAQDTVITITAANETTEIVNLTGAELPSTGGIGTTIFYVVGGLLAVGAGVLLITRKRAGEEE